MARILIGSLLLLGVAGGCDTPHQGPGTEAQGRRALGPDYDRYNKDLRDIKDPPGR